MSRSAFDLIVTVDHLFTRFDGYVEAARWTDAALAAAGMWQATDDALGGASTPLAKALAEARTRPGLVGSSAVHVLDAALGLRARPARRVRAGEQGVDGWRETLIVIFDCGGYTTAGTATPTMEDANGVKTVLPPYNFQCGNNVMTFNTQVTLTAYELTATAFDVFCN